MVPSVPAPEADPALEPGSEISETVEGTSVPASTADTAAAPGTEDGEGAAPEGRRAALAAAPRVAIATDKVSGSISLMGGRIDDLKLNDYQTTLDADAEIVTLLSPKGRAMPTTRFTVGPPVRASPPMPSRVSTRFGP